MTPGRLRSLVGASLLALVGCTEDGCWWGDPNDPGPMPARLGEAYATDDGRFTITLQAADPAQPWPPTVEPFALVAEIDPKVPGEPIGIAVERPQTDDGAWTAEAAPQAVVEGPRTWRIEPFALDVPGTWTVPFEVAGEDTSDTLVLHFDVRE